MATKKQAAARAKFAKAARAKGNTKLGRRAKEHRSAQAQEARQVARVSSRDVHPAMGRYDAGVSGHTKLN
jgi:hypothetical protein